MAEEEEAAALRALLNGEAGARPEGPVVLCVLTLACGRVGRWLVLPSPLQGAPECDPDAQAGSLLRRGCCAFGGGL